MAAEIKSPAHARVIWLQMPVVSPADKWVRDSMENARSPCSRALVEVTWVLVQKRWQDRSANHNVGQTVGSGYSISLAVSLRARLEIWAVCRLAYAGDEAYAQGGDWISRNFHGKLKLQFWCERLGISVVYNIEVRYDAQNALLFFPCYLLLSDLRPGITHIDCGLHVLKPKPAFGQEFVLVWLKHDGL